MDNTLLNNDEKNIVKTKTKDCWPLVLVSQKNDKEPVNQQIQCIDQFDAEIQQNDTFKSSIKFSAAIPQVNDIC